MPERPVVPSDAQSTPVDAATIDNQPPIAVVQPRHRTAPLVFASPHSGNDYAPEFLAASQLDLLTLRRSEDAFIDRLFGAAAEHGAPLLKALFPRSYVDPNRERLELDPAMFDDPLPAEANVTSPRVAAGLGTIARVVTSGEEIYRGKLTFSEVRRRIERHYDPYHAALRRMTEETVATFGACLVIDCHSMPSVGGPMDSDSGLRRVDFVLGDRFGVACAPAIIDTAERLLQRLGYTVRRNVPYAGGFTTRHYGRPRQGVHALQIEINRALYMDEVRVEPKPALPQIRQHVTELIGGLVALEPAVLAAA
jgi:N-formylglutamate amidohydrolase